ncbi:hypothetical protein DLD82_03005 [Methanospirillum stamsii]|uniref:Uncharacterized protein n=1 Tax=Methanospirillum stamsii TaxID=1277351 RepID=A0A2V2NAP8_9EURY|nr:hypothetical protein DLD82_03005 [Methanospirillum stamsii]
MGTGIDTYDALHISCANESKAIFLTVDEVLIKSCLKTQSSIVIQSRGDSGLGHTDSVFSWDSATLHDIKTIEITNARKTLIACPVKMILWDSNHPILT